MRIPVLVLLTLFASLGALGVQDPFQVVVDVNLITLDVGVTDPSGKAVTTLTREEFQIYEDGRLQQVRSFTSVDTPYNVLMLFDCSGSTAPSWPFLIEAVNRFTGSLRKQDGISMAQFGDGFKRLLDWRVRTGQPFDVSVQTNDASCRGTDLYGALDRAAGEFKGRPGRRGVVTLTDGQHASIPHERENARFVDSSEDKDFQKLLRSVATGDIVFYFVAVDTDLNPGPPGSTRGYNPMDIYNMLQARSRIEQLATASGGRVSFPKNPGDVVPLYEQIARELGTSYGLGYTSSNIAKDGKVRKIEVRVKDPAMKVRLSKESYEAR